ncbi:hypothetical protein [Kitasatospora sp. NPDC091207]|uniref:hypothetical protein n=1 Tax=Kitasatospora sp. NPDC091207 TaxID=3364083 RepID=UPI00382F448D
MRVGNVDGVPDFAYESTLNGEARRMEWYASALQDPRNKVTSKRSPTIPRPPPTSTR